MPESDARSVCQLAAPHAAGRFITGQQHVDTVPLSRRPIPRSLSHGFGFFSFFFFFLLLLLHYVPCGGFTELESSVGGFFLLSLGRFISPRQAACTVQLFVTGTD